MDEQQILFRGGMVRAILEGKKTKTRRVMKKQPRPDFAGASGPELESFTQQCRYGPAGTRLWVRETWAETDTADGTPVVAYKAGGCIAVGRDGPKGQDHLIPAFAWDTTPHVERWMPSIFMPRWASRITLEVTGVHVERLKDITAEEAVAEGVCGPDEVDPVGAYRSLWEAINGRDSWSQNQMVWVIEFRRVR